MEPVSLQHRQSELHARQTGMEKEELRQYALQIGADAVGFAAVEDYRSPRSPNPASILPGVRSIVVLGYRETHGAVESENPRISMGSRMGGMELSMKNNYLLSRYIETTFGSKAAPVPFSYPLDMGPEANGIIGDVSMRHAAVAAGLGAFGRHNLVIHPRYGTRIVFTAILTDLPLASDPPVEENPCTDCNLCVESCPAGALDEEGRTDVFKCLKSSQPYGIGGAYRFLKKLLGAKSEERQEILKDPVLLHLYQAQMIGFQYTCFRCMAVCPACME
jgi:epoxyqueuosine reductase QueG